MHQSIIQSQTSTITKDGARFEPSYYGMPKTFMKDDDVGSYWLGSFRQVNKAIGGNPGLGVFRSVKAVVFQSVFA